tara:strand:+ start:57 stop:386 length:330 start_codon:yes stop_codon:yes gene_type:complete
MPYSTQTKHHNERLSFSEESESVDLYAQAFIRTIKEWLTPEQCAEVDARNLKEDDDLICHTHDFCDANMAMMAAFEEVDGEEPNVSDESWCGLASKAWAIAISSGFGGA